MNEIAIERDGEFSGWSNFPSEPFNCHVGPYYHRLNENGAVCAYRPKVESTNGLGVVHGGALLSFADYSMYVAAQARYATKHVVTVSIASEFLGIAKPGDYVEARTEVVSAGGSLIVLRGIMTAEGRPVLNYSATFKRLSRKAEQGE